MKSGELQSDYIVSDKARSGQARQVTSVLLGYRKTGLSSDGSPQVGFHQVASGMGG